MGGWADAGAVPTTPQVDGATTTTPVSQQILDKLNTLPADQKALWAAVDAVVPLNTLSADQIKNLGTLNKAEFGNMAKLDPTAIKKMLAQDPDAFKAQVQQLDQRGWPGAKDKTAPADGKAWSDPDAKADAKKPDDKADAMQKKMEDAQKRTEAQERAKALVEHVRVCNKAQQDALLSAIHMMI